GDIAVRNADGDLVILGRKDDMIKINGNRVEPDEIAAVVRETLGLPWCAARGFTRKNGKGYICVYYPQDCSFNKDALREELKKKLPSYMLPACYVAIGEVPLLPTGKMNKRALPEPDLHGSDIAYEPPADPLEERITAEMEKWLEVTPIGRRDSFRRMGGDSVDAMMIAAALQDEIPEASYILRYDTPAEIAKASREHAGKALSGIRPAEMADHYEITSGFYYLYADQSHSDLSIRTAVRLTEDVVPEYLQEAAELLLRDLPALSLALESAPDRSRYVLVPCSRPFRVVCLDDYIAVPEAETQAYLFSVSYFADTVRITVSHGLTDGAGAKTLLRVLLEHYLRLKGDIAGSGMKQNKLCDYSDPEAYLEQLPVPARRFPFNVPKTPLFTDDEVDNDDQKVSVISFSMQTAMKLARQAEGSVQAILSLILGAAIRDASHGEKKEITVTCPMDMRSRFGCTHTLRNCTTGYKLRISEKLMARAFTDQLSAVKGMQYLQDCEEFWIPKCINTVQNRKRFDALPTIDAKKADLSPTANEIGYPVLTFLGDMELDHLTDHIRSVRCATRVQGTAGMILIAFVIRGRCFVCICSAVTDDSWKALFIAKLKDIGLDVKEE
ncbi:MAG: phosphopantetheine-binding protein, partial [Clostridia bacterium]|nr:phosphopantetheine-binding protein [Clostridia bacterium]